MRFHTPMLAAVCVAFALFAGTVSAAGGKKGAAGGGPGVRALDAMSKALATVVLDDTQTTSTKQVLADAEGRLAALRDQVKGSADPKAARQAARGELVKILKETRDKVDAVLNADQVKTFHAALKTTREELKTERDAKKDERGAKKDAKAGKNDAPATQPAN